MKIKDVVKLEKKHECGTCDLLDFERDQITGYNQALTEIGEKEIVVDEDKLIAELYSGTDWDMKYCKSKAKSIANNLNTILKERT